MCVERTSRKSGGWRRTPLFWRRCANTAEGRLEAEVVTTNRRKFTEHVNIQGTSGSFLSLSGPNGVTPVIHT